MRRHTWTRERASPRSRDWHSSCARAHAASAAREPAALLCYIPSVSGVTTDIPSCQHPGLAQFLRETTRRQSASKTCIERNKGASPRIRDCA